MITSGRLSASSASDRHRPGWSTKSAFRRRCGCRGRRLTRNWCGEVQRGAAGSDQGSHEVVVTAADSGQLGETVPVVDSGLVEGGFYESGRNRCLQALALTQHPSVD